jgi:hypothetical protein
MHSFAHSDLVVAEKELQVQVQVQFRIMAKPTPHTPNTAATTSKPQASQFPNEDIRNTKNQL